MAICHNKAYEREFRNMMIEKGYHCEHIAGSGCGHDAVCDCIWFKDNMTHLVEVKAVKDKIFYMRSNVKVQLQRMIDVCIKNNLVPILAIKFKNRGWNILKIEELKNVEFSKEVQGYEDSNTGQNIKST